MSWWTSGSEAAALETLFAAFRESNPDVDAVNGAVAGGAGSKAIVELAKRLQRGDPPDVWQTFAGKSVQGYARRGDVRSVASVFDADRLGARMHPTILRSLMRDGQPYGVPTGAHRSNVLWFNRSCSREAGVTPPSSGYTVPAFLADLAKVKASGAMPLCLGGQGPLHHGRAVREHAAELDRDARLERHGRRQARLAQRPGADRAEALRRDARLHRPGGEPPDLGPGDAGSSRAGGCAFESMNDSAFGELVAAGAAEGEDFGSAPFPGTDASFLAVVDVFVAATKAKNAKNALAFLGGISQPSTQLAFNRAKGSVPVVRDIDCRVADRLPAGSSKALWTSPVLLSVAHGEAMSPEFQEGFYDAVSTYVRTRIATPSRTTSRTPSPRTSSPRAERAGHRETCAKAARAPARWLGR